MSSDITICVICARYHVGVTGVFGHVNMFPVGSGLFLSLFAALGLLSGTGFLFGHFWLTVELAAGSLSCKHKPTGRTCS